MRTNVQEGPRGRCFTGLRGNIVCDWFSVTSHRLHLRVYFDLFQAEGEPGGGRLPQDQPHRRHMVRLDEQLCHKDKQRSHRTL